MTAHLSPTPKDGNTLILNHLFQENDAFLDTLATIKQHVLNRLQTHLDNRRHKLPSTPSKLFDAMSYAAIGEGKFLRPYLFLSSCFALGYRFDCSETNSELLDICCAIECIQAYSLVHDDLPGMDNSDLRRGKPSVHVAFDHHTAIIAGSALQHLAFEILSRLTVLGPAIPQLIYTLSQATGGEGMMGGQQLDMDYETSNCSLSAQDIMQMLFLKSGMFFQGCLLMAWDLFGKQDKAIEDQLKKASDAFGLAYQIGDDLADLLSDQGAEGKPVQQDAEKKTLLALWGLEKTTAEYQRLTQAYITSLKALPGNTQPLMDIHLYLDNKLSRLRS